jgi:thiol-disulfide isomerase/thioredoxin
MTSELTPQTWNAASDTQRGRRKLLISVAGASAALAGLGAAWWRSSQAVAATEPIPGFWDLQWESPSGEVLLANSFRARPLLINFWATWCPPCVEELPLINAFYRENKVNGWQVLALAVDRLAPVKSFLVKNPLDFPVGIAALSGADLGRSLGNLTGGLPFSVVVGGDGAVRQRKLGRLNADELAILRRLK